MTVYCTHVMSHPVVTADWCLLPLVVGAGVKQVVHHGIIREDASDNTEVKLDVPLGTDSIKGLNGSK